MLWQSVFVCFPFTDFVTGRALN